MLELPPKLAEFMSNLDLFPDRADRIQLLIGVAERFEPVPAEVAVRPFDERHRVPGCESEAFAWAIRMPDGGMRLEFAVENPQGVSAKALGVILKECLDGETAETIALVPDDIVYQIFGRELSMGKSMGLTGVVRMVKALAASA